MISTTNRTPLEPLVRPTTLAKLVDQQHSQEKDGHRRSQTVDDRRGNSFSHQSRGRISGRMRFSINKKEEEKREGEKPIVNKDQEQEREKGDKLFASKNEIIDSNLRSNNYYSALTQDKQRKVALGAMPHKKTPKTGGGASRGSKKYRFNSHDKEEVQFMQNRIAGSYNDVEEDDAVTKSSRSSTTTKRSTTKSKFANKYNIDYDNMLEDEYEIIEKVE